MSSMLCTASTFWNLILQHFFLVHETSSKFADASSMNFPGSAGDESQ